MKIDTGTETAQHSTAHGWCEVIAGVVAFLVGCLDCGVTWRYSGGGRDEAEADEAVGVACSCAGHAIFNSRHDLARTSETCSARWPSRTRVKERCRMFLAKGKM